MRIKAMSAASVLILAAVAAAADKPLSLHPDNPHYFLFRGKPTILLTSGEHYGAVLNADFDYLPYLDELKAAPVQSDAHFLRNIPRRPVRVRHC